VWGWGTGVGFDMKGGRFVPNRMAESGTPLTITPPPSNSPPPKPPRHQTTQIRPEDGPLQHELGPLLPQGQRRHHRAHEAPRDAAVKGEVLGPVRLQRGDVSSEPRGLQERDGERGAVACSARVGGGCRRAGVETTPPKSKHPLTKPVNLRSTPLQSIKPNQHPTP